MLKTMGDFFGLWDALIELEAGWFEAVRHEKKDDKKDRIGQHIKKVHKEDSFSRTRTI